MRSSTQSCWTLIAGTVLVAFGIATSAPAVATSGFGDAFAARYPNSQTQVRAGCNTCHGGSSGNFNAYGRDLRRSNAGSRALRLAAVEGVDSDQEGHSNLVEINADAQPGWCAVTSCDNNGRTPPAGLAPLDPSTLQPPVANAGGPYSGTVNVAITFNGAASSDPDGSVVGYQWSFGDGAVAAGAMPIYAYPATGTYTVTLTVTDSDGLTHSAVTTAQVTDGSGLLSPVARIGGPYGGTVATPVSFDGSASSDADGTIVRFDWTFGDGTADSGAQLMHVYHSVGVYTVVLTVTDDSGRTTSATTTASVSIRESDRGGGGRVDIVLLLGLSLVGLSRRRRTGRDTAAPAPETLCDVVGPIAGGPDGRYG